MISPPTQKQLDYLARLIGARREYELRNYVCKVLGINPNRIGGVNLTTADYSRAIQHALEKLKGSPP